MKIILKKPVEITLIFSRQLKCVYFTLFATHPLILLPLTINKLYGKK